MIWPLLYISKGIDTPEETPSLVNFEPVTDKTHVRVGSGAKMDTIQNDDLMAWPQAEIDDDEVPENDGTDSVWTPLVLVLLKI